MAVLVPGHGTIDALIERAKLQGMTYIELGLALVRSDGELAPIRYLENPNTRQRFMLTGFDEGELVGPSVRAAIERRLGITLADS